MYICVIILRHICLPACLHYSLGAPCHSLNIERGLLWHWAIFPSSDLSGGPAVNSSQVFGLRAAWAWHALCFWTGVSVFVPDRELEIRGRHFCTCIPFTFHLISLTIALPLQLSDTLVMLSLHALNCSCSSGDFFCVCVCFGKIHRDKTERHNPADLYDQRELWMSRRGWSLWTRGEESKPVSEIQSVTEHRSCPGKSQLSTPRSALCFCAFGWELIETVLYRLAW